MPWFPLPELMTTGREQPLIRASEPAAARGAGADFYVIAVFIQQRAANLCTVWMTETFIGNGRVHGDLTVKNFFDVFDLHSIGKFKNILDVQHTFINVFRGILMRRNLIKYLTIFYDA